MIGARFELELLSQIVHEELPDAEDLEHWERLSEFAAWEGAGRLRFLHDLFRAVAYEGLSFKRRREIHGRVGALIEERAGESVADVADLLSLHYHRADEHTKAWEYSVMAGRRAQDRSANVEAIELYERALDVAEGAGADPAEVAVVAQALGDVAELSARYDDAEAAYKRAAEAVPDDVITNCHLLRKQGIVSERRGRYTDALELYERALGVLDAAEDEVKRLRSQSDVETAFAGVKLRQGQFDEARTWAERAAASADAGDDRTRLAYAYDLSYIAAVYSGERASDERDDALAILEEVGRPRRG